MSTVTMEAKVVLQRLTTTIEDVSGFSSDLLSDFDGDPMCAALLEPNKIKVNGPCGHDAELHIGVLLPVVVKTATDISDRQQFEMHFRCCIVLVLNTMSAIIVHVWYTGGSL